MASIRYTQSMIAANAVLRALKKLVHDKPKSWNGKFFIESYSNGREQGYCLKGYHEGEVICVSFSGFANSDDIVVYIGDNLTISVTGNIPNEESHRMKKLFPPVAYERAAEYIFGILEEFIGDQDV